MNEDICDLNDVMRVLGQIEGKIDGVNQRLDTVNGRIGKHDDKIQILQSYQDQMTGKTTIIGGIAGAALGIIGAWVGNKLGL